MAFGAAPRPLARSRRIWRRRRWQRGGHLWPDCESAGLAPESADPAWRQIDLLRRNWEEKRSRRLEEEDGSGGGGAGGAEGMATIYHDVPPNN
jgi:hypothetical protein